MQSMVLHNTDWEKTFDHVSRAPATQRIRLEISQASVASTDVIVAFRGVTYDPNSAVLFLRGETVDYFITRPLEVALGFVGSDIIHIEVEARDDFRYRITFVPPLHLPDVLLTFAPVASQ